MTLALEGLGARQGVPHGLREKSGERMVGSTDGQRILEAENEPADELFAMNQRKRKVGFGVDFRMQSRGGLRILRAKLFRRLQPDRLTPFQRHGEWRFVVKRDGCAQVLTVAGVTTSIEDTNLISVDHANHSERRFEHVEALTDHDLRHVRRKLRRSQSGRDVKEPIGSVGKLFRSITRRRQLLVGVGKVFRHHLRLFDLQRDLSVDLLELDHVRLGSDARDPQGVGHPADHQRQHEEHDDVGKLFGMGEFELAEWWQHRVVDRDQRQHCREKTGPKPEISRTERDGRGKDQSVRNATQPLKQECEHKPDGGEADRAQIPRRVRTPAS